FFMRSVLHRAVYKCRNHEGCIMSKRTRNRCQYCRLLQCLKVGMNVKAIREDRMPGGRTRHTGAVKYSSECISRILKGDYSDPGDSGIFAPSGYFPLSPHVMEPHLSRFPRIGPSSVFCSGIPRHCIPCTPPALWNHPGLWTYSRPWLDPMHPGQIPDISRFSAAGQPWSLLAPSSLGETHLPPYGHRVLLDAEKATLAAMEFEKRRLTDARDRCRNLHMLSELSRQRDSHLKDAVTIKKEPECVQDSQCGVSNVDDEQEHKQTVLRFSEIIVSLCNVHSEWIKRQPILDKLTSEEVAILTTKSFFSVTIITALISGEKYFLSRLAQLLQTYVIPTRYQTQESRMFCKKLLTLCKHLLDLRLSSEEWAVLKSFCFLRQNILISHHLTETERLANHFTQVLHYLSSSVTLQPATRVQAMLDVLEPLKVVGENLSEYPLEQLPSIFKQLLLHPVEDAK
ncbi:nuclear receptor subfamily 6 group A member 1-like, partial [Lingula anatina]|uniref:Nuclear receptor subfamily 6 group A member 1-like n=1 Tax=Lingula anatina TaxID=7574 RepID=A0A1S3JCU5_LINAN